MWLLICVSLYFINVCYARLRSGQNCFFKKLELTKVNIYFFFLIKKIGISFKFWSNIIFD